MWKRADETNFLVTSIQLTLNGSGIISVLEPDCFSGS